MELEEFTELYGYAKLGTISDIELIYKELDKIGIARKLTKPQAKVILRVYSLGKRREMLEERAMRSPPMQEYSIKNT